MHAVDEDLQNPVFVTFVIFFERNLIKLMITLKSRSIVQVPQLE